MSTSEVKEVLATEAGGNPGSATRPYFTLRVKNTVDAQGRIQFPSRWRARASGTTLVAWMREMTVAVPVAGDPTLSDKKTVRYVEVMPADLFEEQYDRVMAGCSNDGARHAAQRRLSRRIVELDFDGSGRFSLPEELKGPADLKGTAWLVGCVYKFQIWSPDNLSAVELSDAQMLANEKLDL